MKATFTESNSTGAAPDRQRDGGDPAPSRYRVEALAKGLAILRLYDDTVTTLRLSDITARTGIPMPTAFRLVATLEAEGFLEKTSDGGYRPGLSVLTLGSATLRGSSLVQLSEKPLRELAATTGETVNLGVLLGDQVLYLVRLRNSDIVTANIQVGSTLPAVYTSMGKVLLAHLPADELDALLEGGSFPRGFGPNAVVDRAHLDDQLAQIRADGYAIQDEELATGLRSVSAPVFRGRELVAAINIAVSATRHDLDSLRGPLLDRLKGTAHEISLRLAAS